MFDYDKWQEIFNTISKHKLRTFLTSLGVFWGIFMLVFLMGSGKGLENGVTGMMGDHATNALFVWTQRTSKPFMGLRPGRRAQLTYDDIKAIETHFGDRIKYVAPRLMVPAGPITNGEHSGSFDVRGERPDIQKISNFKMAAGRFINEFDLRERRKTAVVGSMVAETLFDDKENEDIIGESLKINGNKYTIVGIFQANRMSAGDGEDDQTIFIPLTTAQQVTNRPNDIHWFVCTMQDNVKVSAVEDDLKGLLRKRHKIAPDDDQGVRSFNLEEEFNQMQGLFFGIRLIVWIVGIGSLLAGIIGVGNIMLIVVKERTKEIGIRKAMGATPKSIIGLILLESVFITTMAGYIGLVVSTGLIALMNIGIGDGSDFFANPEVDLTVGFGALVILIFAGALTGLIPALQAAKVNPVVALRDE